MANRIVLGNMGSTQGLRVSKPGFSVFSGNINEMLFDSDYGYYQVRDTYNIVLVGSNSAISSMTVNHNYGTVPLALIAINSSISYSSGSPTFTNVGIAISTSANNIKLVSTGYLGAGNGRGYTVYLLTEYM